MSYIAMDTNDEFKGEFAKNPLAKFSTCTQCLIVSTVVFTLITFISFMAGNSAINPQCEHHGDDGDWETNTKMCFVDGYSCFITDQAWDDTLCGDYRRYIDPAMCSDSRFPCYLDPNLAALFDIVDIDWSEVDETLKEMDYEGYITEYSEYECIAASPCVATIQSVDYMDRTALFLSLIFGISCPIVVCISLCCHNCACCWKCGGTPPGKEKNSGHVGTQPGTIQKAMHDMQHMQPGQPHVVMMMQGANGMPQPMQMNQVPYAQPIYAQPNSSM